jgi:hypothetical protein
MKLIKRKDGLTMAEPETALEAVEQLEEFLIADFGQKDWSRKFLKKHFAICKRYIKKQVYEYLRRG